MDDQPDLTPEMQAPKIDAPKIDVTDSPAPAAVDPEIKSPLARFHGERPPAPRWYERVIAKRPERSFVEVEGAPIELLTWGERGKPGLLFVHGGRAHADWWSFIAPLFARDYRVAALSLSGMGRSGWRPAYTMDLYAAEAVAAMEAGGLFDSPEMPIVVGHSFGGWITMYVNMVHGPRLKATVILDSGLRSRRGTPEESPIQPRPNRVYPTLEAALARFRLMPEQRCENLFLLDYIAREALKPAPLPEGEGGGEGWTWRFDPDMGRAMSPDFFVKVGDALSKPACPLALIWGDRSNIVGRDMIEHTLEQAPAGVPHLLIPNAAHHLFLDQPLAVVSALRGLLAAWPG